MNARNAVPEMKPTRQPDFENLLAVLRRECPPRPVLFEFSICEQHLRRCVEEAGRTWRESGSPEDIVSNQIEGFRAAGYDFATFPLWAADLMRFDSATRDRLASVGLAHGGVITDRESFERFSWPDPEAGDCGIFERIAPRVPEGMKLVLYGPKGVLENLVALVGYEELCYLIADDRDLVRDIADAIGSRLLRFYERCLAHDVFGAAFVNDDWGFKTQLFLSPPDLREFVFPWHRKIVAAIHARGMPAILHSCGLMEAVWENIIEDLRFDGKHSYEDTIQPVEDVYERFAGRLAILGGMDMDFLCRQPADHVERRCRAMLELASERGGYALGSGNSIPDYVPWESFAALRRTALDARSQ